MNIVALTCTFSKLKKYKFNESVINQFSVKASKRMKNRHKKQLVSKHVREFREVQLLKSSHSVQ